MLMHPRGETIFINCTDGLIRSIDLGSGVILQTFGHTTFRSNNNRRFTISPCGTIILTTDAQEICGWNLLNGTQLSTIKLPIAQHHPKFYISSMNFHQHSNFIVASVYGSGSDGGLFLLGNKADDTSGTTNNLEKLNPILKPRIAETDILENQDLCKIIQRIDDIFLLPQNKTDDLKSASVSAQSILASLAADHGEASENNTFVISTDAVEDLHIASHSSTSRSGTFTVHAAEDESESNDNRTFSIEKEHSEQKNDGTFSVKKDVVDGNSDDTTISESL